MNPVYKMYLEDLERRKRLGLSPLGYSVTPEGKLTMEMSTTFEDDIPGATRGLTRGLDLSGESSESTPEWAEYLTPSRYGGAYRRGQEKAMDETYWLDKQYPTKKKTVITQEDGKPTKKVTTETEDTEGERSQYDIMLEQARDHAAGNTPSLPNIPGISDVEAGRTSQPSSEQEGTELWYWLDDMIRRRKEREEATDKQFPPNKWNMPYNPEDVGIPGHPFETTAEREARLRGGIAEAAWDQDEADQVGIANFTQAPAAAPSMPGWGDTNLRDPAVLAYRDKQRAEAEATQAEEDRIWGSYKYDVGSARKQYETDMAEIYKKAMQLSMFDIDPSAFVTLATKRMEQTSAFDEQERLQKIQRGIYYTEDGKWDPPSSKRVAFNRAKRFGAGVKLASAISGFDPGKEKKTGAMQSFYKFIEGTGWTTETVRSGSDRADELAAEGYTVDRPYVDRENKSVDASLMRRMNDALEVGNIGAAIQAYVERHTVKYDQMAGGVNVDKIRAAAGDIVWDRLKYRYKDKVEMLDEMPPSDPEKLRLWEEDLRKRGILYLRLPDGNIVDVVD